MRTERLDFPGHDGSMLAARLDRPDDTPRAYALFAHCFTCGKDIKAASRIAGALADEGIATLRFDFTGLGGSEGEFGNEGFHSNVEDLIAAAGFMRDSERPVSILIGHSLGGAAVIAAAGALPECRAVGVIGAPFEADHVLHLLGDKRRQIETDGEAEVQLAGRGFRIGRSFLEETVGHDQPQRIAGLRRPLLILHAPLDEIVPVDNARRIFEAARHPKSFVSLDDADHLLTRASDARYAAAVIAAWAARYLPESPPQEGTTPAPGVTVTETGHGRLQQDIRAGVHHLLADEPVAQGGGDSGPTPYDLLLAGLGACTSMTLRLYAEHKGWPLERVTVQLAHDRIHARDCADCQTQEGRIDRITRRLHLEGELSGEQRRRLMEMADRCPVHRTLMGEIRIETEAASPDQPAAGS